MGRRWHPTSAMFQSLQLRHGNKSWGMTRPQSRPAVAVGPRSRWAPAGHGREKVQRILRICMKLALSCLLRYPQLDRVRASQVRPQSRDQASTALQHQPVADLVDCASCTMSAPAPSDLSTSSPSTSTYMRLLASFMFRWQEQPHIGCMHRDVEPDDSLTSKRASGKKCCPVFLVDAS
jgi:hypothetical protein